MSERKKQLWLRPDQADLVETCLRFVEARIDENAVTDSAVAKMAKRYTRRRIDEVLDMFRASPAEIMQNFAKRVENSSPD